MHIALIIDALATGGKERQILELIKGLKRYTGIEVTLILFSEINEFQDIESFNVKVINIRRKHRYSLNPFSQLYDLFKKLEPDVIHSWNLMCSVYAIPASRFLRINFINGIIRDAPTRLKKFSVQSFFRRITFHFSDIILANSQAGLNAYRVSSAKGRFIYNGFDMSRIHLTDVTSKIKQDLRLFTDFVIIMIARFTPQKDYLTYLETAKSIIDQRSDVTFLAVGDGPTLDGIKNSLDLTYSNYFRFTGNHSHVEKLISVSDIGVLSTYTEGISNVLLEYMAFQKPIIVTNGGGTSETVIDGETGYLVRQGDKEDLKDKICFLLDNKQKATKMGLRGFERLNSVFSLQNMTSAHFKLYKSCMGLE